MSSRKRKQAIRTTREEIRAGRTPTEEATPGQGERLAAAVDRRRREAVHATEQGQLRAARRSPAGRLPMDRFDTAQDERRWDFMVLHMQGQVSRLKMSVARWLDNPQYPYLALAWRILQRDAPASCRALEMVLTIVDSLPAGSALSDPDVVALAEEGAAQALGVPVSLIRRRAGSAVRALRLECHGALSPPLQAYAQVRDRRWRRGGHLPVPVPYLRQRD